MENILSVKQIKKSFGGVHALKGVDLTIKKRRDTLSGRRKRLWKINNHQGNLRILQTGGGSIEVDGKAYPVMTPSEAIKAGIQVIYQDFSIFPN